MSEPTQPDLGWRSSLPADIQTNESLAKFSDVGALSKDYLAQTSKVTALEAASKDYIPKLPANATDADRNLYYSALGRPEKPTDYKLDGEDANAPEWTGFWKGELHKLGVTQEQANGLSAAMNAQMTKMVAAHNEKMRSEVAIAETKLREEWKSDFDKNAELAKRMLKEHGGVELDQAFDGATSAGRLGFMRALVKFAALTGEDRSPQSTNRPAVQGVNNPYPKSQMPPARTTGFPPIQ
jgi:hypothetical protein